MHIFSALMVVLSLTFPLPARAFSSAPSKGSTELRVAIGEDIFTADPAIASDTQTIEVLSLVHATLFESSFINGVPKTQPLLAHDWPQVSADRMKVKVRIRPGVKFHPKGVFADKAPRELKAQDFAYAFARLALPVLDSDGYSIFARMIVGMRELRTRLGSLNQDQWKEALLQGVEGIKAIDDLTLEFSLLRPVAAFEDYLTLLASAPVPVETAAKEIQDSTGTGPFMLENWKRGKQISLRRHHDVFPHFYPTHGTEQDRKQGLLADAGKPLPLTDRIEIFVARDLRESWTRFQSGEIDIHPTLVPSAAETAKLRQIEAGGSLQFLVFNFKDPVLGSKPALRKAIRAAIDRSRWAKDLGEGSMPAGSSILTPSAEDAKKSAPDLELAKKLLKEAGYPDGKGLPELRLDLRASDFQTLALGRSIAEQLGRVGIKVFVIQNPFQDYLQKLKRGEFQIAQGAWSSDLMRAESVLELFYFPPSSSPQKLKIWMSPGLNTVSFNDPFYNAWFERLLPLPIGPERDFAIRKLEQILDQEAVVIPGAWPARRFSAQPWVLNLPDRTTGLTRNQLKYIRVVPDMMPQARR